MNGFSRSFYAGLVVSCVLIASAPAALAEDLMDAVPEIVPEVSIETSTIGSWYLRGDLGYSWNDFRGAEFETDISHRMNGDLTGSFLIGTGVGYQFTDYLRSDVTLDYMTRSKFDVKRFGTDCAVGTGCSSDGRSHYSALSVLANAYVDLGNFVGVTPYLGAGIGSTRIDWADFENVNNGQSLEGAANWRFTYAFMAGASVDLMPNLKLDAGYRFRHVNGGKMFDGNQDIGSGHDKGMNVHDIRIGLRYLFGG